MKKIVIAISILLSQQLIFAQSPSDALRYARIDPLGSGRSVGVSGSMSAIGADFATISDNPAGLAAYRFSEIVISPTLYLHSTKSSLLNSGYFNEDKYSTALDNIGLVFVRNGYEGAKWRAVNFAVGINKLADYNRKFYFEGATTGSITDLWREQSLHQSPDDLDGFGSGLAYEAGAIYDGNSDKVYESDFLSYANKSVLKSQSVSYAGSQSELQFALGGNYMDKILFGAALAIPMIKFTEEKQYEEADPANQNPVFDHLRFNEFLQTKGTGANLKLGLIFKLHDAFRLGFSFQTPSLLELEDEYSTNMSYSFVDKGQLDTYDKESQIGNYTYNLTTPMRAGASFGSVIGRNGFIGGSVEWVDYTQSNFALDSDPNYENDLNQEINKQYQSALNFRAGAEIAIDIFRLRGGVHLQGSPYSNETEYSPSYSMGLGVRGGKFFTDLALRHTIYDDGYLPYSTNSNDLQLVKSKYNLSRLVLTLGYKF